jgi:ABC-type antimicrobial peptide transport system permease subunit
MLKNYLTVALRNLLRNKAFTWRVFALSGLGMILIAFLTLGIQTIRAARANPIDSLRTE